MTDAIAAAWIQALPSYVTAAVAAYALSQWRKQTTGRTEIEAAQSCLAKLKELSSTMREVQQASAIGLEAENSEGFETSYHWLGHLVGERLKSAWQAFKEFQNSYYVVQASLPDHHLDYALRLRGHLSALQGYALLAYPSKGLYDESGQRTRRSIDAFNRLHGINFTDTDISKQIVLTVDSLEQILRAAISPNSWQVEIYRKLLWYLHSGSKREVSHSIEGAEHR